MFFSISDMPAHYVLPQIWTIYLRNAKLLNSCKCACLRHIQRLTGSTILKNRPPPITNTKISGLNNYILKPENNLKII